MKPLTSSIVALALALALSPLALGCTAAADDGGATADGAEDELTSAQLAGEYGLGLGLFASLKLERVREGRSLRNVFEAEQVVMCVRAPCPTVHLTGKWFATKSSLKLYPTGQPALTFDAELGGKTLTLKDAQGHELARLERIVAPSGGVAAILAARGISNIRVALPADEAARQAAQYPSAVSFEAALGKALDSFLDDADDPESPLGLVADVDADDACHRATDEETLKCFLDDPSAELGMLKIGESAEQGEDVKDAWIFTVSIDNLSDHGHWAIVDRAGHAATYNYGFN